MSIRGISGLLYFFFNDTATTEIYTLSLHDALPISLNESGFDGNELLARATDPETKAKLIENTEAAVARSEEHTSELQSH